MAQICVTIGRGRHRSMLEEWREVAAAGASLVELRLDCLRREPDLKRLLAERYTPAIVTIRKGSDGGLWKGDEEKRLRLLREAIVAGVDYVDLEHDIAGSVPRFGKTRRIVSLHDMRKVPEDLPGLEKSLREKNADIVKIAGMASSTTEAARMLDMVRQAEGPTIGIAMGYEGFFTRVLGAKYGSPFTYATFNTERSFAPGMPGYRELARDYFYEQIDANTQVYAVIGSPIGHSLSPAVHNTAFRHLGLNKVMVPLQIPAGGLKEAFAALKFLDLRGVSVTIPHKEDVIPLLSGVDKAVELTKACNTIVAGEDGRWTGHNTDYSAAVISLELAMGGPIEGSSPLLDKQVLILGAGGVARAIAFGVARRGAVVTVCNRSGDRAQRLSEEVGCRVTPWEAREVTPCEILINCTPIGMHPEVDDSAVKGMAFRQNMVAFDTVYHPENTLFLKLAQERECTTVSGVDMFVRQAAVQFEHYTGKNAPMDVMRGVVKRKFSPLRDDS